ncbi:MAG: acyltransferase [Prevotellaceae bacterium]|jgi:peptidoglycan/LPS O-acetylase OafA/YrhL|nr:acyltransferase [Prevotellaceae bacterium]
MIKRKILFCKTQEKIQDVFIRKTQENNHYDYVDALRGLAILGVIMVHTGQYVTLFVPFIFKNFLNNGQMGVQLFYLASALTLFLSMKNRTLKEQYPTKNFFIRRFFRIAPLYYMAIIYYLWQNGFGTRYWLGDATHISIENILSNIFFLHGFNPYWINSLVPGGWSVGVEMMFYAILPFLFSKIKNINQAFNFFTITILTMTVLKNILNNFDPTNSNHLWGEYLYFYLPSQLPLFALGIILYFIIIERISLTEISGKSLLVFSCILLGGLFIGKNIFFPRQVIFGIGFFIFAVAISRYKFKLIVNPLINYIGKISFSMYLIHFAILHWSSKFHFIDSVTNGVLNFCVRYLIVVVLTIIVSTLSYHIVEIPFQKIGKKIIKKGEST